MIDFIRSFGFALFGLSQGLKTERNFRVIWLGGLGLTILCFLFDFESHQQALFLLLIFLMLALELLNCSIEKSCDRLGAYPHPLIKQAKDFAAAAVFLMALACSLIFILICGDSWQAIYVELLYNPWPWLGTALILLLNLPLCIAQKLGYFFLLIPVPALVVHVMIIMSQPGPILFLVLGLIFHVSLYCSYLKRLS